MAQEYLFQGPSLDVTIPNCSTSEFFLPLLRKLDQNKIIQVNGETGESQTVREFLTSAVQVAEALNSRNIGPGDVVASLGSYSPNHFSVIIGAALQCAPHFAIDPSFKKLEMERMFSTCSPRIVFADVEILDYVLAALEAIGNDSEVFVLNSTKRHSSPRVYPFDAILEEVDVDAFKARSVSDPSKETAIILGSSGTTGMPKAVERTHTNVIYDSFAWKPERIGQGDSYLQVTHVFWMTGYFATYFTVFHGTKRIYLPNITPDNMIAAIDKYKPQYSFIAPIYLSWILNHPDFEQYDVSSLKHIQTGGSVLPNVTVDAYREKWPKNGGSLSQLYGATETGCIADSPPDAPVSCAGKLVRGMTAKVSDPNTGEALGPGKTGELLFKPAHGMMKGYMKNPEATAEAIDKQGFYHTGDLGHITEDGLVFITNRIKDLIKCRNHQVSPTELEDTIVRMNGVKDAAVIGVPHEIDQYRPKAAVVRNPDSNITEQEVIDFVAESLSLTKHLYGGVQFVEFIPRNNNGKIIRNKVKEMLGVAL